MLAHHPKTGAPIRIMTSNSSIWKNQKTLVWLDGSESSTIPWNRWDVGASSLVAWNQLIAKGIKVDVCYPSGPIQETVDWLMAGHAESCKIIGVSQAVIKAITLEKVAEIGITNMVCMEETFVLYPYIDTSWDGSEQDARVVLSLILQYGKTFPVCHTTHSVIANVLGLYIYDSLQKPSPLYLVTQYYKPSKSSRAKEIDYTLKMNNECKYIDKIVLLNESMFELPLHSEKIVQYNISTRLRFDTVLKWIYDSAPEDALICIANSDIYLDDSWKALSSVNMDSVFFALLRWDDIENSESPKLFGPRADSQDSWVVSARSVKARTWNWESLHFPFGQGGCDNAFTVEMLRQKFLVINPCMTLITHHVHMSGYRTYDPADVVEKPTYMYVNPSGIHDLNPIVSFVTRPYKTVECNACPLTLKGIISSSQKATLLTMLSKDLEIPLLDGGTTYGKFTIPLYNFKNVFQLPTGLLRTYTSILVGPSTAAANAWSNQEVSITSASVSIEVGLIASCPDAIAMNPVRYLLEYMGKIFVLRGSASDAKRGEWLGAKTPEIMEALKVFMWDEDVIPVIERTPNFQSWCKKAYTWLPEDGNNALVTRAEIEALREALYGWTQNPVKRRVVCVVDGIWITDSVVTAIENALNPSIEISCIYPKTSISSKIALINGAWGIIVYGGRNSVERWGCLWALPKGAYVWEVQPEIAPCLELYQTAVHASLNHRFYIVPRITPTTNDVLRMIEGITQMCLNEATSVSLVGSKKSQILMPHKDTTGFFSHAGDSFREMVNIWAEHGYVDIVEIQGLQNVWLNSVGETLLYDRPTLEWLKASSPTERVYKKALFGNPPPTETNSVSWSFWPRRPRLLEDLVAQGVGKSDDRTLDIVFYGRSENAVQRSKRLDSWSSVCSEFIHVIGDKPYPFSQRGYLMRLSNAKWGLCLAGYGNKCHREIECMAMGCVPIVSPEVDMTNYANPPVEGLHYFRVSVPSDIEKIRDITHSKWKKCSEACRDWWKANASAEGFWKLTQHLALKN
jgi:hypothetical protein